MRLITALFGPDKAEYYEHGIKCPIHGKCPMFPWCNSIPPVCYEQTKRKGGSSFHNCEAEMTFPSGTIPPTPEVDAAEEGLMKAAEEHGTAKAWRGSFEWMCGLARSLERKLAQQGYVEERPIAYLVESEMRGRFATLSKTEAYGHTEIFEKARDDGVEKVTPLCRCHISK